MNKQELLDLYHQGERNFRKQDLRGQSFVGQDLSGADFSGSDIRGTDFSQAVLRGANFTNVQAGLQQSEAILLLVFLVLVAVLLGAVAGFVGTLLNLELRAFTNSFQEVTAGWAMVMLLLAFAFISVLEGITTGFSVFALAFMVTVGIAAIGPILSTLINPLSIAVSSAIAQALTIVCAVSGATVMATIAALAAFRTFNLQAGLGVAGAYLLTFGYIVAATDIVTSIVPVVPAVMALSIYLGWRALQGDPKQVVIRRLATTLTARWGTSFRQADLTKANFSHAQLNHTNFDDANLTRVCWTGSHPEAVELTGFYNS